MKFFHFRQNNSGGKFVTDIEKGLGVNVFIQARDQEDANRQAVEIGIYFDGCQKGIDCECCGDRWYRLDTRWDEGTEQPTVYGDPLNTMVASLPGARDSAFSCVHYEFGEKQWFDVENQPVTVTP